MTQTDILASVKKQKKAEKKMNEIKGLGLELELGSLGLILKRSGLVSLMAGGQLELTG